MPRVTVCKCDKCGTECREENQIVSNRIKELYLCVECATNVIQHVLNASDEWDGIIHGWLSGRNSLDPTIPF